MNLGLANEAIAARIPGRECMVFRGRRWTWAQLAERSRRLASWFRWRGLGCHHERAELEYWQSGQDHVALYLHNCGEYVETMLGSFKARAVPFNVNYRYVEEELLELLNDARPRAVVFGAGFAGMVGRLRRSLPSVEYLLQVEDGSGNALLPGATAYEEAIAEGSDEPPPPPLPGEDLYLIYTGGTTGPPKGVLWRQCDLFEAALYDGAPCRSLRQLASRAARSGIRSLAAAPLMHGGAQWAAFRTLHGGGTVLIVSDAKGIRPEQLWALVEEESAQSLLVIGDAVAQPLVDELAHRPYALGSLRVLASGGAPLSESVACELLRRLPQLTILDGLGSSEGGNQAIRIARAVGSEAVGPEFRTLDANSVLLSSDRSRTLQTDSAEIGWLARRGAIPLGYLNDPDATRQSFPVIDGLRYVVPGDRARFRAGGGIELLGRDATTINTGGEKVFAEEVERVLRRHPGILDAAVLGQPSPRWGQEVVALVQPRSGLRPEVEDLTRFARRQLAGYKVPKHIAYVGEVPRWATGKLDYGRARQLLREVPYDGSDRSANRW